MGMVSNFAQAVKETEDKMRQTFFPTKEERSAQIREMEQSIFESVGMEYKAPASNELEQTGIG